MKIIPQLFSQAEVQTWSSYLARLQSFTDSWLEPFNQMAALESDQAGSETPWMYQGDKFAILRHDDIFSPIFLAQLIKLNLDPVETETISAALAFETELVTSEVLPETKPSVNATGQCTAVTKTYRLGNG